MSFWDRYLAPGDVRTARAALVRDGTSKTSTASSSSATDIPTTLKPVERSPRLDPATRARRQNGVLFGGAVFAALSILITRRAVARKVRLAPTTTAIKGEMSPTIAGGFDAAEALGLASLNVFSFGLIGMGVVMKYLDVADVEDLRDKVRSGLGYDVYGGDEKADKELEAWVADILSSQKDGAGLREGLIGKLAELEQAAKAKPEVKSKE